MTYRLLSTRAPEANLLIRFMVGGVFFTEGIQKFLYPDDLGSGRFAKIGLPRYGFLSMMHESRTDLCMIPGSTFLLLTGAGPLSVDARLSRQ